MGEEDQRKASFMETITWKLILECTIIATGTSFVMGYHVNVLNLPAQYINNFYELAYKTRNIDISPSMLNFLWSFTTSIFFPGCFIGSVSSSKVAQKMGRKKCLMISIIPQIIGCILQTICVYCNSPELLIIGRFFCGISAGMALSVVPMYLCEISPVSCRGAICAIHMVSLTIGQLLVTVLGMRQLFGTADRWEYMLLLPVIPALYTLIGFFFVYESPRHLMINEKDEVGARAALEFLLKKEQVEICLNEMHQECSKEMAKPKSVNLFAMIKDQTLRKPLMITVVLPSVAMFSGAVAVFSYSASIFMAAGLAEQNIQYAVFAQNAVNMLTTFATVPLMDRLGRRPFLIYPLCGLLATLASLTLIINLQERFHWLNYLSIFVIVVYMISYAAFVPVLFVICSELFLQETRDTAMALFGVALFSTTIIVLITYVFMVEALGGYVFTVFFAFTLMGFILIYFKVPETKNKTFQEISEMFGIREKKPVPDNDPEQEQLTV